MELREQSLSEAPQEISMDLTLNEEAMTAQKNVEESNDEVCVATDLSKAMSKTDIIAALTAISEKPGAEIVREEVSTLRQHFHALRKSEVAAEREAFLAADGADEAEFVASVDTIEEDFIRITEIIREKKAQHVAEIEAERKANLDKKLAIIAELNAMADDTDNVNRHFPRFNELKAEFKAVGEVPPTDTTDLYRNYSIAMERFYDQLKINKELRDYDFRKNHEQKQLLINEATRLANEDDVITAFRRLQELHDKWREIGPVAKELRDDVWNAFKDASAIVNKRYQAFFEERKARERASEEQKIAICERIEAIDLEKANSAGAWERLTKEILAAQEDWKKVGFAAKKVNNELFARFRATCDKFFAAKAEYFRSMRDTHATNLEKKVALCERAEAIKDSTEWKKTAEQFAAIQQEWRTIGAVDKKNSDAVWTRFKASCDYFFEQRKKATSGARKAEHANLHQKQEIIDELKAIAPDIAREDAIKKLKELTAKWQTIGHVPFKDKDKVYDAYRALVNELQDRFDMKEQRAAIANFSANLEEMAGDQNRLLRERERLTRTLEQKRTELKTYENNLGFFNITSKGGNSLLRDSERRMKHLKEEIESLQEKVRLINSKL